MSVIGLLLGWWLTVTATITRGFFTGHRAFVMVEIMAAFRANLFTHPSPPSDHLESINSESVEIHGFIRRRCPTQPRNKPQCCGTLLIVNSTFGHMSQKSFKRIR